MEKRCPTCNRKFFEEDLNYCLADGSFLLTPGELPPAGQAPTLIISDAPTEIKPRGRAAAPTEGLPADKVSGSLAGGREQASQVTVAASRRETRQLLLIFIIVFTAAFLGVVIVASIFRTPSNDSSNTNAGINTNVTSPTNSGSTTNTNQGAIPSSISDATVEASLKIRLMSDSELRGTTINAVVQNGKVTLIGTVTSAYQKSRAEQIAKEIQGVRSIDNQITVVGSNSNRS